MTKNNKNSVISDIKYDTNTWIGTVMKILHMIVSVHGDKFERTIMKSDRIKQYFSSNPNELAAPKQINGTIIYVESKFAAKKLVEIIFYVIHDSVIRMKI